MEKFFDQTGQVIVNETNTQFIEHIIFIMASTSWYSLVKIIILI